MSFKFPKTIIDATLNGDLVIFAGSGISTENKDIFKKTLYEEILQELKPKGSIDFPSLMSRYCLKEINGRQKLLQKIKERFDYCSLFSELLSNATEFHKIIAPIYPIRTIITTNWDDYFEKCCAAIPIVTPQDFAFYNLPDRKVFKIHGSISNYGSIVATTEDYKKCYNKLYSNLIGGYLKTILATKTVVFVGYSFGDFDFKRIYKLLMDQLEEVLPHCYIITLDDNIKEKTINDRVTIIKTDGKYFFSILKKHLEKQGILIPQQSYDRINSIYEELSFHHFQVTDRLVDDKIVNLVYCAFYQDGLQHAFDALKFHSKTGNTFNPMYIIDKIKAYKLIRIKCMRAKNYPDAIYVDGYIEGLMMMLSKKTSKFPFWYLPGRGPINSKLFFEKSIKKNKIYHKQAEKLGKTYFKKILDKELGLTVHHRPFIGT